MTTTYRDSLQLTNNPETKYSMKTENKQMSFINQSLLLLLYCICLAFTWQVAENIIVGRPWYTLTP